MKCPQCGSSQAIALLNSVDCKVCNAFHGCRLCARAFRAWCRTSDWLHDRTCRCGLAESWVHDRENNTRHRYSVTEST